MSFGDDTLAPPERSDCAGCKEKKVLLYCGSCMDEKRGFQLMTKNMAALIPKDSPGIYFMIIPARADGRVLCKGCGLAYREHPLGMEKDLTLLCDGKQVKL